MFNNNSFINRYDMKTNFCYFLSFNLIDLSKSNELKNFKNNLIYNFDNSNNKNQNKKNQIDNFNDELYMLLLSN